ncbi:MAG: hypothetical protein IJ877_02950 [Candidatus Gastranaerophilales bacterium]|nr:hypothetical protein [Candidatus Gastranaerophilales bacterium]
MSQNYNLNSTFGLNVTGNGSRGSAQKQNIDLVQNAANLFDSMTNYVDKYENVFTGDVEKEINMYSRQMMIVGMNLKAADKTIRKFDMSI